MMDTPPDVQTKEKVVGVVTSLIDRGLFRIGNRTSAQSEKASTYGVSVFEPQHAVIDEAARTITFEYPGKKNVPQRQVITDPVIFEKFREVKAWSAAHPCRDDAGNPKLFCYNAGTRERPVSVPIEGKDISRHLERYTFDDPDLGRVSLNPHQFRSFHANRILQEGMAAGKTYEQSLWDVADALGHFKRDKAGEWEPATQTAEDNYIEQEDVDRYGSYRTAKLPLYKLVLAQMTAESGQDLAGGQREDVIDYLANHPESEAWKGL